MGIHYVPKFILQKFILHWMIHPFLILSLLFTGVVLLFLPTIAYGDTITSSSLNMNTSDLNATNVHLDLSNPSRPKFICANAAFNGLIFSIRGAGGTQTFGTNSFMSASGVSITVTSTTALTEMISPFVTKEDLKSLLDGGTLANVDIKNVQWPIEQFLSSG